MPDIQMCQGESDNGLSCIMRDRCYRYTASPGMVQAFGLPGDDFDGTKCELFLSNETRTGVGIKENKHDD